MVGFRLAVAVEHGHVDAEVLVTRAEGDPVRRVKRSELKMTARFRR
jgi:hypothetical protein